jgi:alkanesulfonate monooxygenase SsuD/methylene tetrahydromethanopterin reductase-like flavin-dependent oxidoreductase (luciferase family)
LLGQRAADPGNWRIAKSIFVADTEDQARKYALAEDGPYYYYYRSLITKLVKAGRANLFKIDQDQVDENLDLDEIVQQLIIFGTPESVTDQLLAFRDEVGQFGTLLYAGHDWKDRALAVRSMELMAADVMPAINSAIGE